MPISYKKIMGITKQKKPILSREALGSHHKVICRMSYNNVKIFQVDPQFVDVSLNDVEDCLSSCTINQTHEQKKELFYSNGIDYDKVFKYYKFVKDLNKIYYKSDQYLSSSIKDVYKNIITTFKNIWVCLQLIFHWLTIR